MPSAKDIIIKPIKAADANALVRRVHYSGKVVNNSQLHLGVFLNGRLEGAMQFGPSLDKRKIQGLVEGTSWNGFIELNRMAFSDNLPRNSESRALGVAFRMMKKTYPHIEWIVSFADGTQCGDGTIYRASGFVLTGIKRNNQIWAAPSGEIFNDTSIRPGIGGERERAKQVFSRTSLTDGRSKQQQQQQAKAVISRTTTTKGSHILENGASSMKAYKEAGWRPLEGFQLRYIYFLNPQARERLTVPIIPFSRIDEIGAGMYRGEKRSKQAMDATSVTATGQHRSDRSNNQAGEAGDGSDQEHSGGATPTHPLQ